MTSPMHYPAPPPADHLRLLSILHYVWAAMGLLGTLLLGAYAVFVGAVLSPDMIERTADPQEFRTAMGIMTSVFVILALVSLAFTVASFLAARWLAARRNRTFCIVVAAIDCLSIPFGTALGVFTILELSKEPVRRSFT